MQPTRKDYAEFFRLGLRARVCRLPAVACWAYEIVDTDPHPPEIIVELCQCQTHPVAVVDYLLAHLPGDITPELPVLMLLGHASRLLEKGIDPLTLLMRLYCVASLPEFPERIYHELAGLEDAYLLARDRIHGPLAAVMQSFVKFVADYECFAPAVML